MYTSANFYNPALALTDFRTTRRARSARPVYNNLTCAAIHSKTSTWSAVNFQNHVTSMSSKPEPTIWLRVSGQRTPRFDRCQLTITWMSNANEGRYKPRVQVSVNLLTGVWSPSCATPSPSCVCAHKQYR